MNAITDQAPIAGTPKVRAYGTRVVRNSKWIHGSRRATWRKIFASREAMLKWAEKNEAKIEGTFDLDAVEETQ